LKDATTTKEYILAIWRKWVFQRVVVLARKACSCFPPVGLFAVQRLDFRDIGSIEVLVVKKVK